MPRKFIQRLIGKWDITPQQLADQLEKSMSGVDPHGWDDLMHVKLANPALDQLLDDLTRKIEHPSVEDHRDQLTAIIASLRLGNIPKA